MILYLIYTSKCTHYKKSDDTCINLVRLLTPPSSQCLAWKWSPSLLFEYSSVFSAIDIPCAYFSVSFILEKFEAYFCLAAHHQASETNINEKKRKMIPWPHHILRSRWKVISSLQKVWSIVINRHHHNVSLQKNPSYIVEALISVINSWHTICLLFRFLTFRAFSQACFPLPPHHQASETNIHKTTNHSHSGHK